MTRIVFTGVTGNAMGGIVSTLMKQLFEADPSQRHALTLVTRTPLDPDNLNVPPELGMGAWNINNVVIDLASEDAKRTTGKLTGGSPIDIVCLAAGISINREASPQELKMRDQNRDAINDAHEALITEMIKTGLLAPTGRIIAISSTFALPAIIPHVASMNSPDHLSYAESKLALAEMIERHSQQSEAFPNATFGVIFPGLIGLPSSPDSPAYPEGFPTQPKTTNFHAILAHGQEHCAYTADFNSRDPTHQLVTPEDIACHIIGNDKSPRMETTILPDKNMGLVQEGPDGQPIWAQATAPDTPSHQPEP